MGEGQVPAGHVKGQKQKGKMVARLSGMKARDELMLKKNTEGQESACKSGQREDGCKNLEYKIWKMNIHSCFQQQNCSLPNSLESSPSKFSCQEL